MERDHRDGQNAYSSGEKAGGNAEGGHQRRVLGRRLVTDYGSSMVQWMRHRRPRYKGGATLESERPSASYIVDMLPPAAKLHNPADSVPAKHLHSSLNKIKHPVNVVRWTPEGRRCLTGSSSGEFTLWNGMAFNFETIMQAHDTAIRAAEYSHSDDWLISADHQGVVKYWQPNFNNVKVVLAHDDAIRDLAFSPNDAKFVTASDDSTLKIFDFATSTEESTLTGHNWDAKSVDWHPTKGLLVSGSKDHQVKLWDPRTGRCLTTLHGHKNTISRVSFEPHRGQLLATCARDSTGRIFDLRMMRDICLLKGHDKEIATLTWHPIHPSLLSTGGVDGSIYHFLLDEPNTPPGISTSIPPYDSPDPANTPAQTIYPAHRIQYAHDFPVWSLHWHPLGHILASGSNDKFTRFWTRARPGETECFNDRYHLGEAGAEAYGTWDRRNNMKAMKEREEQELEDEAEGLVDQQMPTQQPILPGLPGLTMNNPGVAKDGTSVGGAQSLQPVPPPPISFLRGGERPLPPPNGIASMDPAQFAAMMAEGRLMVPPPPMPGANGLPPPLPPNFDFSKMPPPGMFPPGFPPGSNFPVPPLGFVPPPLPGMGANGFASLPGMQPPLPGMAPPPGMGGLGNGPVGIMGAENGGGVRRRAPLPSQEESLMREQQHGKYRLAR